MAFIEDIHQSIRLIWQEEGWQGVRKQAVKFVTLPFYESHRGYLLRKSLREAVVIPSPKVPLSVRQAGADDRSLFETIVPPLRARRFIHKIQSNEEACFIAIHENKIAGFVWVGFTDSPSTRNAGLQLGAKEAYLWAGYAAPDYRASGVVRTVNLSLCNWLREQAYESVALLIEEENAASLTHVYRMGYQLEKRINYLRILNHKRVKFEIADATPDIEEAETLIAAKH